MKIAYNPTGGSALSKSQIDSLKNDIIFDLSGMAVYARGIPVGKVYEPFEKSTSSTTEGYNGLVPFPDYNGNSKTRYLREDGTWHEPVHEGIISYNPTSISLSTDWKASGLILNGQKGFTSGSYLIQITSGNLIFSGTASVYVGKITVEDEIVLHMSGIPQVYEDGTQGRIYAKIAPSEKETNYGEIYLATNVPETEITNLSIKMKKLL